MTTVRYIDREQEKNKLHRMNLAPNFLGGSFRNRDNLTASLQWGRESQAQHLKRCFFLKNRPIHVQIVEPVLLDQSNKPRVFPTLKSTNHFLRQCLVDQT